MLQDFVDGHGQFTFRLLPNRRLKPRVQGEIIFSCLLPLPDDVISDGSWGGRCADESLERYFSWEQDRKEVITLQCARISGKAKNGAFKNSINSLISQQKHVHGL